MSEPASESEHARHNEPPLPHLVGETGSRMKNPKALFLLSVLTILISMGLLYLGFIGRGVSKIMALSLGYISVLASIYGMVESWIAQRKQITLSEQGSQGKQSRHE